MLISATPYSTEKSRIFDYFDSKVTNTDNHFRHIYYYAPHQSKTVNEATSQIMLCCVFADILIAHAA